MIETAIRVKADLDKGIRKTFLDTLFVTKDKAAHRFEIEVVRGDAPVTLSGTVSAYFIRYCDNVTIPVSGTLSGNKVSVTLNDTCYNRNTQFALVVKVSSSSETGTVFYGESTMHIGETDGFIDESNVIPSLDDLLDQITMMEQVTEEAENAIDRANVATNNASMAAANANIAAGRSPFIGSNGNWFIWDNGVTTDTGTPAQGPQGEQGPSGTMTGTVESAAKLDGKTLAQIMLEIYPVGSIYISTVGTNPKTLFGGEWEQLMGKFLLGANDTYAAGSTGGEATHVLTVPEIPEHTHKFGYITGAVASGDRFARIDSDRTNASSSFIESTGGGAAHNNMPPYLAVYMWKRIS